MHGRLLRTDLVKIWKSSISETGVGVSGLFERAYHVGSTGCSLKLVYF